MNDKNNLDVSGLSILNTQIFSSLHDLIPPYIEVAQSGANSSFSEYFSMATGPIGQIFTQHVTGVYGLALYNMTDDLKKLSGDGTEVYVTATPAIDHQTTDMVYMNVKAEWKDVKGMYHQTSQMVDFTNFTLFKDNKSVDPRDISSAIRKSQSTFIKTMHDATGFERKVVMAKEFEAMPIAVISTQQSLHVLGAAMAEAIENNFVYSGNNPEEKDIVLIHSHNIQPTSSLDANQQQLIERINKAFPKQARVYPWFTKALQSKADRTLMLQFENRANLLRKQKHELSNDSSSYKDIDVVANVGVIFAINNRQVLGASIWDGRELGTKELNNYIKIVNIAYSDNVSLKERNDANFEAYRMTAEHTQIISTKDFGNRKVIPSFIGSESTNSKRFFFNR